MERPVYRVSQVNAYVKRMLAQDVTLSNLRMTGEISNFKRHSSGHLYFALKDEGGAISSVMFASDASTLRFLPREGTKVIAQGSVSLYEKTGQYQFYIRRMEPDGLGALYQAYEALKQKLSAEGLFDQSRKRKISAYPQTVAIVTSPTGAAVQDMIQIARRRHPGIRLIVVPVLVQGVQAAPSIVQGLQRAAACGADTIIVGRGGGSSEDLWAFNEEMVARAIAACPVPVISAVGHETDFTIADFAADMRAPTPSAAAELAVPMAAEVLDGLQNLYNRQRTALSRRIQMERRILEQIMDRPVYKRPGAILDSRRQELDMRFDSLQGLSKQYLQDVKGCLNELKLRLSYLDPAHPLGRGYAYVTGEDGSIMSSIQSARKGQTVHIHLSDGQLDAQVENIQEDSHGSEYDI
ncbi:MAG: exodeoxyribonuclease VII large subunit [Firmicutes bacterium]|nr:exodeoxyribonuclease VII large subunit [Bacillota bacterium]